MPSPYSYVDYGTGTSQITGDQLNGIFTPNLAYVSTDDIYVTWTVDSTGEVINLLSNQFTVTESPQFTVTFTFPISGYSSVNANDLVRIGRTTDVDQKARTYSDGSVLKASDINTQNNQFLYAIQESLDTGTGALPIDTSGHYDAGGRRIKNIGEPVDATDVASKSYVIGQALYNGAELPQSWTFTTPTQASGDYVFDLVSPIPASDIEDLFLVEVAGVLQVPLTDYTVSIVGTTYKLTLLNGVTNIGSGQQVAVRNFGTRRQVLSTPFKSDGTNATLRLEGLPGQTVPYFEAKDSNSTNVFSISSSGALLFGAGTAPNQLATGYHDLSQFGVGRIDESGGTVNYDEYGVRGQVAGNLGIVDIQGIDEGSSQKALRIIRLDSTGTVHFPLQATYGGALDLEGTLTAVAVIANNPTGTALTVTGEAVHTGDIQMSLANPYKIYWGASGLEVEEDGLNQAKRIKIENFTTGTDGDSGIIPMAAGTSGTGGVFAINTSEGNPFIAHGGDGNGVAYGGLGSAYFTYAGGRREGPRLTVRNDALVVNGYGVDANQGGAAGQTGNEPASLRLTDFTSTAWVDVGSDNVVTKEQIAAHVQDVSPPTEYALFSCSASDVTLPTDFNASTAPLNLSTPVFSRDLNSRFTWSTSNDWIQLNSNNTSSEYYIVTYSGLYSTTGETLMLNIAYSDDGTTWNQGTAEGGDYYTNPLGDGTTLIVWKAFVRGSGANRYIQVQHRASGGTPIVYLGNGQVEIRRVQ